jgi:hypothetical protein
MTAVRATSPSAVIAPSDQKPPDLAFDGVLSNVAKGAS